MSSDKEILKYLKNLTLGEFISLLSNNDSSNEKYSIKKVYTTDELLLEYPMFSRYTLNKAIKEQKLPFYREGHKMYFKKELIDIWIEEHTSTYNKKNKYRV